MNRNQPGFTLSRKLRKVFVTGFVLVTFGAYALHEHLVNPNGTATDNPIGSSSQVLNLPRLTPTRTLRATATPPRAKQGSSAAIPTASALPTLSPPTDEPLPTDVPAQPTDVPVA